MKVYGSPSSQQANIGADGYNEEIVQNEIADLYLPELTRHGIEVMRNNPANNYADHVRESNLFKPDFHIAMHSNASAASSSHTARGCCVYCFDPMDRNNPGTLLAEYLHSFFMEIPVVNNRGIRSGKLFLSEIAKTTAPAVLVEIDFHDNAAGARWIIEHKKEIANAYLLGTLTAFGIPYIPIILTPSYIYRVQVGAFRFEKYALLQQEKLKEAGFDSIIRKEELK